MSTIWDNGSNDGNLATGANYSSGAPSPTLEAEFQLDGIGDPSTDGGSPRTWKGVSIDCAGNAYDGTTKFNKLSLGSVGFTASDSEGGGSLSIKFVSINGPVSSSGIDGGVSLILTNQAVGQTATIHGGIALSTSGGAGTISLAADFDNQVSPQDFAGTLSTATASDVGLGDVGLNAGITLTASSTGRFTNFTCASYTPGVATITGDVGQTVAPGATLAGTKSAAVTFTGCGIGGQNLANFADNGATWSGDVPDAETMGEELGALVSLALHGASAESAFLGTITVALPTYTAALSGGDGDTDDYVKRGTAGTMSLTLGPSTSGTFDVDLTADAAIFAGPSATITVSVNPSTPTVVPLDFSGIGGVLTAVDIAADSGGAADDPDDATVTVWTGTVTITTTGPYHDGDTIGGTWTGVNWTPTQVQMHWDGGEITWNLAGATIGAGTWEATVAPPAETTFTPGSDYAIRLRDAGNDLTVDSAAVTVAAAGGGSGQKRKFVHRRLHTLRRG